LGIHVYLSIEPERIEPERWASLYDEVLRVVRGYPDGAMGLGPLDVQGVETRAYLDECVRDEVIYISGDRRSRLTGETFVFPRVLPRPRHPLDGPESLLVKQVLHDEWYPHHIFGGKTQGLPFHTLILAIAMLAENRLPGLAFATGDIVPADAEPACALLEGVLGGTFDPPIVVDEVRLREHLAEHLDEAQVEEGMELLWRPADPAFYGDLLGLLKREPESRVRGDLDRRLVNVRRIDELDPFTVEVLETFARTVDEVFVRVDLHAKPLGPFEVWDREPFMEWLARWSNQSFILTQAAWDELRETPIEQLQFCVALTLVRFTGFQGWIPWGALESAVVRAYLWEIWNETR
jgi:hypothetical protein